MRNRREWLLALGLLCCHQVASAQLLTSLFPEGVPGYGSEQGVTVLSRARPAFEPLGIHLDPFMIRPLLTSSLGYDSNVFAGTRARGAWEISTSPSILIGTSSAASSVGLYVSADDVRYLGQSSQNRTDGAAFLGGTFAIGRDKMTVGGGYLSRHEDRTALDALPSDRPVAFNVANLRLSYATEFGRLTLTPSVEVNRWRFDDTTILGVPVSESARDRTTAQSGVTLRYSLMSGRDLLWVNRVMTSHYDHPIAGLASNNSTSWQSLVGIGYDDNTVWQYRLLAGVQYRAPTSGAVAPETAGIAEAEVIWSPSGMTTFHAIAARGIEDAAQAGLSNYTYTSARLSIDHEYLRNILLSGSATVREATFNQTGGQQFGIAFGSGVTWLINRNARLSLTYDLSDVRNSHLPVGTVAGNYTRSLTLLTLRLGL